MREKRYQNEQDRLGQISNEHGNRQGNVEVEPTTLFFGLAEAAYGFVAVELPIILETEKPGPARLAGTRPTHVTDPVERAPWTLAL